MEKAVKNMNNNAGPNAVYGLGLLGALVYFLQDAHTIGQGLMGLLKSLVWPALFVYKVFEFLKL